MSGKNPKRARGKFVAAARHSLSAAIHSFCLFKTGHAIFSF